MDFVWVRKKLGETDETGQIDQALCILLNKDSLSTTYSDFNFVSITDGRFCICALCSRIIKLHDIIYFLNFLLIGFSGPNLKAILFSNWRK